MAWLFEKMAWPTEGLISAVLHGVLNALQLPFKGLFGEFKLARTMEAILFKDSKDPKFEEA